MTKTQEEFQQADAVAAAVFFDRCQFHFRQGIYNGEDKFVCYYTRETERAKVLMDLLPDNWTASLGVDPERLGAAVIIYNYSRKITQDEVLVFMEHANEIHLAKCNEAEAKRAAAANN